MNLFDKIKKIIAIQKYKFFRGNSYFNAILLGFVASSTLREYAPLPIYITFPGVVFIIWFAGALDTRWHMINYENQFVFSKTPQIGEIQEQLKFLEDKINKLLEVKNEKENKTEE